MDRIFAALGAFSGFIAVAAGAFGAHALRQRLPPELVAVFETGARYQMYHALALLAAAWAAGQSRSRAINCAGWCFVAGTLLFCGSLYVLALTGKGWVGMITPLGGVAFLAGWLALAWGVLNHRA
jgi:uncharacterized membrane protein YgdD (TMEM256/DUF423 family)